MATVYRKLSATVARRRIAHPQECALAKFSLSDGRISTSTGRAASYRAQRAKRRPPGACCQWFRRLCGPKREMESSGQARGWLAVSHFVAGRAFEQGHCQGPAQARPRPCQRNGERKWRQRNPAISAICVKAHSPHPTSERRMRCFHTCANRWILLDHDHPEVCSPQADAIERAFLQTGKSALPAPVREPSEAYVGTKLGTGPLM
jgi:hypothetical protein